MLECSCAGRRPRLTEEGARIGSDFTDGEHGSGQRDWFVRTVIVKDWCRMSLAMNPLQAKEGLHRQMPHFMGSAILAASPLQDLSAMDCGPRNKRQPRERIDWRAAA